MMWEGEHVEKVPLKMTFPCASAACLLIRNAAVAHDRSNANTVSTTTANTAPIRPWLTGIIESTKSPNQRSATLAWLTGSWSSCSAAAPSCDQTIYGTISRSVSCVATQLQSFPKDSSSYSLCLNVTNTIGAEPASSQSCSRSGSACPPPPDTSSSSSGCGYTRLFVMRTLMVLAVYPMRLALTTGSKNWMQVC